MSRKGPFPGEPGPLEDRRRILRAQLARDQTAGAFFDSLAVATDRGSFAADLRGEASRAQERAAAAAALQDAAGRPSLVAPALIAAARVAGALAAVALDGPRRWSQAMRRALQDAQARADRRLARHDGDAPDASPPGGRRTQRRRHRPRRGAGDETRR